MLQGTMVFKKAEKDSFFLPRNHTLFQSHKSLKLNINQISN